MDPQAAISPAPYRASRLKLLLRARKRRVPNAKIKRRPGGAVYVSDVETRLENDRGLAVAPMKLGGRACSEWLGVHGDDVA